MVYKKSCLFRRFNVLEVIAFLVETFFENIPIKVK
jgi:hypothetical protein